MCASSTATSSAPSAATGTRNGRAMSASTGSSDCRAIGSNTTTDSLTNTARGIGVKAPMPLAFYTVIAHCCTLSECQTIVLGNLADFFE